MILVRRLREEFVESQMGTPIPAGEDLKISGPGEDATLTIRLVSFYRNELDIEMTVAEWNAFRVRVNAFIQAANA